jgi:rhodanese-related sulfurtransferase
MILVAGTVFANGAPESYVEFLDTLYRDTVPLMRPSELKELLDEDQSDLLLLDVRTAAERRVSYIPGSRFVDFESFALEELDGVRRTQQVVLYCAVGYRSERVGEMLLEAGFSEVYNLYGGIIEWYNLSYPIIAGAAGDVMNVSPVVHGYSPRWGRWVSRADVTYEPKPE